MNYRPQNIGLQIIVAMFRFTAHKIKKLMKKIFMILLCLPLLSIAQKKEPDLIPKNANVIIAQGTSFKQVVNAVLDAGYILEKIDSNYNTIKTEYKPLCENCLPQLSISN